MTSDPGAVRARIHERGDRRLDGIRSLIEEAGRPRPLADVLATLCREIAEVADVDVASVYVLEPDERGDDLLVLRGNVGFPAEAVGRVRLRIGEGLTGLAAECLQPVSLAVARDGERYRHFDGLGEERFPSYLGLPVLSRGRIAGVLVLQRREPREPDPAEVALAASLVAPVAFALERAALAAAPPRPVVLTGEGQGGGVIAGRLAFLPSLERVLAENVPRGSDAGRQAALAHAQVARELTATARRLAASELDAELRALSMLLEDPGPRDLISAACRTHGEAGGLAVAARDLARAPYRVPGTRPGGRWLAEGAMELEDLCLLVGARMVGRLLPPRDALLGAARLSGIVALAAAAHGALGLVVSGDGRESELGVAVARAAGLPLVTGVANLQAGARDDDELHLDGRTGRVSIRPPAPRPVP